MQSTECGAHDCTSSPTGELLLRKTNFAGSLPCEETFFYGRMKERGNPRCEIARPELLGDRGLELTCTN